MTDCGPTHMPTIKQLGCQVKQLHVDPHGRPLLLISVVVKVMARLYYGSSWTQVNMPAASPEDQSRVSSSTAPTAIHTSPMNPRIYQELFDLRLLVVTLILKSPARNSRALTVVMMQGLLLVNRILMHSEAHSIEGLPQSLKSPRALFMACLTLAEACLMDSQTSTRTWSKVSCLAPTEIARLKKVALTHLEYKVHVNAKEFGWWCKVVMEWMQLVQ
ncbi:hypothetical protein BJ741DRAFT_603069 [Chytriomyces cf. hyalinus JEL632]|nr:hypothetical protein BJ741DRAFT_603069 [Chytriomyces cf. hyalinus JEL632]